MYSSPTSFMMLTLIIKVYGSTDCLSGVNALKCS